MGAKSPRERERILADLFTQHQDRLRLMVQLRLDRRIQARVDPSDILQDVFLEATRRLDEYCRDPSVPVFLWLRGLTVQKLLDAHRFHLRKRRDVRRDISLERGWGPPSQSGLMAERLLGCGLSPSQAAIAAEGKARLEEALNRMEEIDREIVALRHIERLTAAEAAEILGIGKEAAKKRYLRAMMKLRAILAEMPDLREDLEP